MAIGWGDDEDPIDPNISCGKCEAVCCRLLVLVMPDDPTPRGYVAVDEHGLEVMARGEEGWCIALDMQRMCCSIYELRPQACRSFTMGASDCRGERAEYAGRYAVIESTLLP
jgi:Fe-S-cluster containining protein